MIHFPILCEHKHKNTMKYFGLKQNWIISLVKYKLTFHYIFFPFSHENTKNILCLLKIFTELK